MSEPQQSKISADELCDRFTHVRETTCALVAPLAIEDFCIQPMDDASPPKWHLAHTTWFFETFVLKPWLSDYKAHHPLFEYLFNSYYNGVGRPYPRPQRGHLSRPTVDEVMAYRSSVQREIIQLLTVCGDDEELRRRIELGIHHEQQHQELILTDLKYNFGHNPLFPEYGGKITADVPVKAPGFVGFAGGVVPIGANAEGFVFDNELPAHEVLIPPFEFADRLVSNGEFLEFVLDGGYQKPHLWLSEGWSIVETQGWNKPLYWHERDGHWFEYRLDGLSPLNLDLPVVHVSAHEAFAFAQWCDCRLPTEFEFETVLRSHSEHHEDTFLNEERFHPAGYVSGGVMQQLRGVVWQWTASSYSPYPGYRPLPGTLGEYNGKFMSSQLVLRGGSCVTPRSHYRDTYRNFFYPPDRWQFSGIRLARDVLQSNR